ncbi:MAG: acyl-CoA desaturase [Terriglobia bacterium]
MIQQAQQTMFATVPAVRDRFASAKALYLLGIHLAALAAFWHSTWAAVGVCLLLHWLCGGLGICVGYHRLLTHRSFRCPKPLEYAFATLGALSLQGAPIEWVSHHRQHHQFPDQHGDPHSARRSFWWSHMVWIIWDHSDPSLQDDVEKRYVPDLLRVPFYRFLNWGYVPITLLLAGLLYWLGGWPFVIWGIFVRVVLTYHCTFLVNSASHTFGYRTFPTDDLSTNCWWVSLLAYGEGWHNNHHAFPTSARHGFKPSEVDPSFWFIRLMEKAGIARDVRLPALRHQPELSRELVR